MKRLLLGGNARARARSQRSVAKALNKQSLPNGVLCVWQPLSRQSSTSPSSKALFHDVRDRRKCLTRQDCIGWRGAPVWGETRRRGGARRRNCSGSLDAPTSAWTRSPAEARAASSSASGPRRQLRDRGLPRPRLARHSVAPVASRPACGCRRDAPSLRLAPPGARARTRSGPHAVVANSGQCDRAILCLPYPPRRVFQRPACESKQVLLYLG